MIKRACKTAIKARFNGDYMKRTKREYIPLAITREDINKYMQLKSDHNSIRYWENIIMSKVKHGKLSNNKEELIYWMIGVTDGWIEFKL